MIAFGFLGIETVAVTAFEAHTSRSLRLPSQSIAYVVLLLYFLCLLGQCLNVSWRDEHLPLIYGGIGDSTTNTNELKNPTSSNLTIIALWAQGQKGLAGFLNGAMIFSVISAANTSLYVASRTLYGIARDVPTTNWLGKSLNSFSVVVPKTGVPARALIFSAVAFLWLPFLSLKGGYAVQYVSHDQSGRNTTRLTVNQGHRDIPDLCKCQLPDCLGFHILCIFALLHLVRQAHYVLPHLKLY
jgi:amino acid transporter